jgi:ferredoxin-thioredoxin reductase catalytic subunit
MSAFAELNGYKLNPDKRRVDMVLRGLLGREERYGEFLCPCRTITGDQQIDSTIVCPCCFMHDDVWLYGYCHCKLFFRKDFEGNWITSSMDSQLGRKRKKEEET